MTGGGMARDRTVIVVPRAARRLWLASRLAPGAFLRITARNARIERRRAAALDHAGGGTNR